MDISVSKKSKHGKCPICSKKLSILDIVCKCGLKHCREHCLPEYHNCSFDISAEKNEKLENDLVTIDNDRIDFRI